MRIGSQVANRSAKAPALPMPYPTLAAAGLAIRRGQVSMWAAAPGVGKSQMLGNIAARMQVPTFYWSADTDLHDVTVRQIAMWSEETCSSVDGYLQDPGWVQWVATQKAKSDHIEWEFDPSITGPGVEARVMAFAEIRGEFPHLIVIDNLSNTVRDQSQEIGEQKAVIKSLQELARATRAHIAILHHVVGEYESGNRPIPMAGVANKLLKLPEVGVTIHRAGPDLALNLVKNRSGGASDPAAVTPLLMPADFTRATVGGYAK